MSKFRLSISLAFNCPKTCGGGGGHVQDMGGQEAGIIGDRKKIQEENLPRGVWSSSSSKQRGVLDASQVEKNLTDIGLNCITCELLLLRMDTAHLIVNFISVKLPKSQSCPPVYS